jgi:copper homeostasis protein
MIDVEICIQATDGAAVYRAVQAAREGGAGRIELCSQMHLQGLTPSPATIEQARRAWGPEAGLLAMIRPRSGDFAYTRAEIDGMRHQILAASQAGADGVVLGALEATGQTINRPATQWLLEQADTCDLAVTFHRAFDALADPATALRQLIELGVRRVLTSGTVWGHRGTALDGAPRIAQLARLARSDCEIVIGGGVSADNVRDILDRIGPVPCRLSVHAYSSVLENGTTSAARVRALVDSVGKWR